MSGPPNFIRSTKLLLLLQRRIGETEQERVRRGQGGVKRGEGSTQKSPWGPGVLAPIVSTATYSNNMESQTLS